MIWPMGRSDMWTDGGIVMIKRAGRVLGRMMSGYLQDLHFSLPLAHWRFMGTVSGYLHQTSFGNKANTKAQQIILNELSTIVGETVNQYRNDTNQGETVENAPIWLFWWTGEKDAPALVKQCIASVRKHIADHPVVVLDQYNIGEYLSIPSYILEKVQTKRICLANFSDYVRFSLLNQYGGMWIDATIYLSQAIPEICFALPVFSCNSPTPSTFVSIGKWTAFVFSGRKGHVLFRFMQAAFEKYWESQNSAIDYLLVDYLIRIAYENNQRIRQDIDSIPINNLHRNTLRWAMNNCKPAEEFHKYLFSDTCFNKLSWREKYKLRDEIERETVYSYFLQLNDEEL